MTYRDPRDAKIASLEHDKQELIAGNVKLQRELTEARYALAEQRKPKREDVASDPRVRFSPLRPLLAAPRRVARWVVWQLMCDMAISYPSRSDVDSMDGFPLFIVSMFGVGLPLLALRWYLRSALHFDDDRVYKRFVAWCGR